MIIQKQLRCWGLFFIVLFFLPLMAQAAYPLSVFNDNLQLIRQVNTERDDESGIFDFNVVDLGGDGVNEFIVSEGYKYRPRVILYRLDGSKINSWQPYPDGYEGKINVVSADFNNDNRDEIITVPGESGGPHVRVFDGYGNVKYDGGFFAYNEGYRSGLEVTTGDVDGNGKLEIIVSLLDENKNIVRFFDQWGNTVNDDLVIEVDSFFEPMKVTTYDLNNDGKDEVILGGSMGGKPLVYVFNSKTGEINSFLAYAETFRGGMDVAAGKVMGKNVIVTGAGFSGGPHVRFFDINGNVVIESNFFVYDDNFRGGLNISLGNFSGINQIAVYPQTITENGDSSAFGKVIKVDLNEQKLYAYNMGRLIKSFLISSGKPGFDTPEGNFYVYKKRPSVHMSWYYGPDDPNNYDLPGVPHVLSFKGPYTIHAAWWHSNWGHVMSHGCVNVSMKLAEWLYDWTPLYTPVIITK